ncbi:hypothetical protein PC116_g25329 [Phytophthora cactorum]|uniref:Uncharacterized protein n=1 Tax=Phytophthora cactorum TaxID=29920 RepID=A0A8T1JS59_9STRA|nr:hypothetical protein PC117_g24338 [Phytophthora cactorum]KAG2968982.1 hypothetical protein PC119_g24070 [Phytophthora cactorum]KAG3194708.1 hypothetical protein PC128_g9107 [Phytophthora cactorum]KAG4226260.1 hypothetical protein PC116_g25329 [Phytophthora cactorum]
MNGLEAVRERLDRYAGVSAGTRVLLLTLLLLPVSLRVLRLMCGLLR